MKSRFVITFVALTAAATAAPAALANPRGTFGGPVPPPNWSGAPPAPYTRPANPYGGVGFGVPPATPSRPAARAPMAPVAPVTQPSTVGPDRFKPYRGSSVYSGRGGVDADPSPKRPRGGHSPYGY